MKIEVGISTLLHIPVRTWPIKFVQCCCHSLCQRHFDQYILIIILIITRFSPLMKPILLWVLLFSEMACYVLMGILNHTYSCMSWWLSAAAVFRWLASSFIGPRCGTVWRQSISCFQFSKNCAPSSQNSTSHSRFTDYSDLSFLTAA